MAKRTGADELRYAVQVINSQPENFNDKYTAEQLLKLARAYMVDETAPYPAFWTERQIRDALRGKAPQWNANMKPVYA